MPSLRPRGFTYRVWPVVASEEMSFRATTSAPRSEDRSLNLEARLLTAATMSAPVVGIWNVAAPALRPSFASRLASRATSQPSCGFRTTTAGESPSLRKGKLYDRKILRSVTWSLRSLLVVAMRATMRDVAGGKGGRGMTRYLSLGHHQRPEAPLPLPAHRDDHMRFLPSFRAAAHLTCPQ